MIFCAAKAIIDIIAEFQIWGFGDLGIWEPTSDSNYSRIL
jgi:hypothetical protein